MKEKRAISCFFVAMLVASFVASSAEALVQSGEYVRVSASVNPEVIKLGESTRVTITLSGNGTPEIIFPLDVVLVMDCSGSMKRYGTIITNLSEVTLTGSYQKIGEFTIASSEDVEVMLQTLPGRGYGADVYSTYDRYYCYLRNKVTGTTKEAKSGYSVVRWNNLQPGTYEVYAKLYYYRLGYTQPHRAFCVELPPERRAGAKSAANDFVDLLKEDDRVAVVKFHSSGWSYSPYCKVICNLWDGKSAAKNTINGLPASGGTPMGEGLARAIDHLEAHGRDDAVKAIILLTDGWWNMGYNPIDEAERAAEDGIPIYVIGWGGVNYDELTQIADITGGESYFPATSEDLRRIYEGLAKKLSNIAAKDVTLSVELSDAVDYAGNANRAPDVIAGKVLKWNLGTISVNQTLSISFDVVPRKSGKVSINTAHSKVTYEDVFGNLHEVPLPILSVTVTEPPVAVAKANPRETLTYSDILFDASQSYDPDGFIASYEWDFDGDGLSDASGKTVTHNFIDGTRNYTVTLTVTDNYGMKNRTTIEVRVKNRAPSASIIGPIVMREGEIAEFIANASDIDGFIVSYEWDFGDGSSDEGERVTHVFTSPGKYTVTLTVKDDDGATVSATHEIKVLENLPPVAIAEASNLTTVKVDNLTVLQYEPVTFDGTKSYDPDGHIKSHIWNFKDGNISYLAGCLHKYVVPGKYNVDFIVTDEYNKSSYCTVNVTVLPDTDGDGLSDYEEHNLGTNATDPDTDDDGFSDGEEMAKNADPRNKESKPNATISEDYDCDGLSNSKEEEIGTNSTNPDTDGDGFSDGEEVRKGSNPIDVKSTPPNPGICYFRIENVTKSKQQLYIGEIQFINVEVAINGNFTYAVLIDDTKIGESNVSRSFIYIPSASGNQKIKIDAYHHGVRLDGYPVTVDEMFVRKKRVESSNET